MAIVYRGHRLTPVEQAGGGWRIELGRSLITRRFAELADAIDEARRIIDRGVLDGVLGRSIVASCGTCEERNSTRSMRN